MLKKIKNYASQVTILGWLIVAILLSLVVLAIFTVDKGGFLGTNYFATIQYDHQITVAEVRDTAQDQGLEVNWVEIVNSNTANIQSNSISTSLDNINTQLNEQNGIVNANVYRQDSLNLILNYLPAIATALIAGLISILIVIFVVYRKSKLLKKLKLSLPFSLMIIASLIVSAAAGVIISQIGFELTFMTLDLYVIFNTTAILMVATMYLLLDPEDILKLFFE